MGFKRPQVQVLSPRFYLALNLPTMADNANTEKRKYARINEAFKAEYRLETEEKYSECEINNISLAGMLITVDKEILKEAMLNMTIQLPLSNVKRKLIARVLDCKKITGTNYYNSRIEIVKIDNKTREAILQTVGYYLKTKQLKKDGFA